MSITTTPFGSTEAQAARDLIGGTALGDTRNELLKQILVATANRTGGSGGGTWGSITGTLSNQTDLQTALNAKLSLAGGTMTGDLTTKAAGLLIPGSVSGTVTIQAPPVAGTPTITFPSVTSTLATLGANAFTGAQTVLIGTNSPTAVSALNLTNSTAATAGVQSASPFVTWTGHGWKTDATAGSQSVDFKAFVLPVQGSAAPTATWTLQSAINGGSFSDAFKVTSAGAATLGSGAIGGVLNLKGTGATATISTGFGDTITVSTPIGCSGVSLTGGSVLGRNAAASIYLPAGGQMGFGSTSDNFGANDTFFVRKAAATMQLGLDAAGVTNQMLTAASRITSDGVGANLTIAPGNGRGAAGGSLILSTYTTGSAGVAGTLTPRLYVNGPDGLLQFGGQTASYCALKGDTTLLAARLADDSGYASFGAGTYYSDGVAGVSASGSTINSITVTNGIITAINIT